MEAQTGAVLTVNGKQIAAYYYHAALRGVQATYQDMLASLRDVLAGEATLQEMVDNYEDSRRIAPSLDWMEEGPFKTSHEISRYYKDEEMKEIYKLLQGENDGNN
jgi:benzoyl-CoA reductase/2-hydroxyglutaryl-CoA dehydratase subunit BcrC/BadD/HgdB